MENINEREFCELFEQSLKQVDMTPGAIVTGTVIDIDSDWVTVHAGLKSEGSYPAISSWMSREISLLQSVMKSQSR